MFRKIFTRLLSTFLTVLIVAAPAAFARGLGGNHSAAKVKKLKNQEHNADLQYQRQRLKQSGQNVHTEARQSGPHPLPPKIERRQMVKVPPHKQLENVNLHNAKKQNRSHHPPKTN